jgi:hypothetical protein
VSPGTVTLFLKMGSAYVVKLNNFKDIDDQVNSYDHK